MVKVAWRSSDVWMYVAYAELWRLDGAWGGLCIRTPVQAAVGESLGKGPRRSGPSLRCSPSHTLTACPAVHNTKAVSLAFCRPRVHSRRLTSQTAAAFASPTRSSRQAFLRTKPGPCPSGATRIPGLNPTSSAANSFLEAVVPSPGCSAAAYRFRGPRSGQRSLPGHRFCGRLPPSVASIHAGFPGASCI